MKTTDHLIKELSSGLAPVAPALAPAGFVLRWLLVAVAYAALILCHFGLRADLAQKLMDPLYLLELLTLLAVVGSAVTAAAFLAYPDVRQKPWVLRIPAVAGGLFVVALGLAYAEQPVGMTVPDHGLDCLLCVTLYAIIPAIWMMMLLKRHASTRIRHAGALALLAAAGVGAVALRLEENTDHIGHLLLWHYLPMLGFGAVGIWLGQKFLRW